MSSTRELVQKIREQFEKEDRCLYEPYVRYIRFPRYKMLAPDTQINFDFPLTVIVGVNGTNKTSVLQAIYGCPAGQNLGVYWFSTETDKILDDNKKRSCFICGYKHLRANQVVEVLKQRMPRKGKRSSDDDAETMKKTWLDYWEPAKPAKRYEMEAIDKGLLQKFGNKATTRWDLPNKNVVYLDCKEYVSAFDLYFYHTHKPEEKIGYGRQDKIRERSKPLKRALEGLQNSDMWHGQRYSEKTIGLSEERCRCIGAIMNKEYDEIKILNHTFYGKSSDNLSPTIWIKEKNKEYTEAFAGSGEARIILMVNNIMNASPKSLLVIDEPEISLHPQAIATFKLFLLNEILQKQHQVVVSTHSDIFIKELPMEAIKVLAPNTNNTSEVVVRENISYLEAFSCIGAKPEEKITIYVEDQLTKYLFEYWLKEKKPGILNENLVVEAVGGAETIIKYYITRSSSSQKKRDFFVLDGDKNYFPFAHLENGASTIIEEMWIDTTSEKIIEDRIPRNQDTNLDQIIKAFTRITELNFFENDQTRKIGKKRQFIRYWETNVFFIGTGVPECDILTAMGETVTQSEAKAHYVKKVQGKGHEAPSSEEILFSQKMDIRQLDENCELFSSINRIINKILPQ